MKIGDVYYEKHTVTKISHRTNTVSETQVERVDVIPYPKTGHWEPKYPTREEMIYCQERYFCSNCKGYVVDRIARLEFNFCPNCGARMKGSE